MPSENNTVRQVTKEWGWIVLSRSSWQRASCPFHQGKSVAVATQCSTRMHLILAWPIPNPTLDRAFQCGIESHWTSPPLTWDLALKQVSVDLSAKQQLGIKGHSICTQFRSLGIEIRISAAPPASPLKMIDFTSYPNTKGRSEISAAPPASPWKWQSAFLFLITKSGSKISAAPPASPWKLECFGFWFSPPKVHPKFRQHFPSWESISTLCGRVSPSNNAWERTPFTTVWSEGT